MRKHVKDRKAKNNAKRLISLVEYFYSKFKDIDKRLQLEEAFLEREDQESFKRFVKEWEKDFEIRRKVINRITGGSDLVRYFKQKSGFLSDVVIGGVMGAAGGLVYNEIRQFFFGVESLTKEEIALVSGGFALIFGIAQVVEGIIDIEQRVHMDELVELEEAVRESRAQARRK